VSGGSVRCPLLVGRDGLLEVAERRLDEVRSGRGQFLIVAGEAGVGKSRFLDAVAQRAKQRGFMVARSATTPLDLDVPGASIHDLGRAMTREPKLADAGRDLIALRARLEVPQHARRRRLVIDTVDGLLAHAKRPLALMFEDLQWTDDLSLEIIAELARQVSALPILLTASYRSDEAPIGSDLRSWRSRLVTQRLAEEVRLGPWSEADAALAITLLLDDGLPAPRDVVAAVYERTDGVPLHVEELLGALEPEARRDGSAIREASVPATIEDALLARLARCSSDARTVAGAGSVIGRAFDAPTVAGLLDRPVPDVDEALDELIGAGIVIRWPDDIRHDFRHQLLRDAVYRHVPASDRRRLHARVAERIAAGGGDDRMDASLH
jgi:predicted ATPase